MSQILTEFLFSQEISILNQKLADSDKILTTLQSQLEESLLKISIQNTEI